MAFGNPNAVPYADRCTKAQFESAGLCPPASLIGEVKVTATAYLFGSPVRETLTGTISIIQTTPEVPTTVGAYVTDPGGLASPVRSYATFYPVTSGPDGDFRIRMVTADFPTTTYIPMLNMYLPIQTNSWSQRLFGVLPSGVPFLTNPTRCDTWYSYPYAEAYGSNTNANSDPLMTGHNEFVAGDSFPTTPDCSTLAPFTMTATASVSSTKRGDSPDFVSTMTIPGIYAAGQSDAIPRRVIATMPKALNVDIQQLGRLCPAENLANDTCPPSTKVGTVSVDTPMIAAGLTGDVYLGTPTTGGSLPNLEIFVRGAINFRMTGTNHYVNGSQLQTTFDNLPQAGFSKFTLTINGGANGLLKTVGCPDGPRTADNGPMTFHLTSYQWQVTNTASNFNFKPCYGVRSITRTRIARKAVRVSPQYRSRSQIRYARLYINGRKVQTSKHSPFRFKAQSVRKYKQGLKRIVVRAFYKDKTVMRRSSIFRVIG